MRSVKCEERSVKCRVQGRPLEQCIAVAQSTHARAWLAHDACKFYRWKRSFSITLRQLPPRLVRVPLVWTTNHFIVGVSNFDLHLWEPMIVTLMQPTKFVHQRSAFIAVNWLRLWSELRKTTPFFFNIVRLTGIAIEMTRFSCKSGAYIWLYNVVRCNYIQLFHKVW